VRGLLYLVALVPSRLPKLSIVLAALLPTMLALGIWLGGHPRWLPDPIADALLGDNGSRIVSEGLDVIKDHYYRPVPDSALSNSALDGAVKDLHDRFSAYLAPDAYGHFRDSLNNRFEGVGMGVSGVPKGLRVSKVYAGSPARKAGIRKGDVIVEANGKKLAGLKDDAAVGLIKGPEGTKVTLRVERAGKTFARTMTRAAIEIPVVATTIERAGGEPVARIQLSTFGPENADDQMSAALHKALKRKVKGIVFDLRGNGGGLVTQAQLIASMFLRNGPIVTTRGRSVEEHTLNATGQPIAPELPLVVLVDQDTASASEIVAGALQDRHRATLVGTRTFGKGVFQEVLPLSNGGALDITVGQYFLPSGRNLGGAGTKQGKGLQPDVAIKDDLKTKRDEQLVKALRVLAKKL
jgi:carboxyl-terminal processing protease